MKIAFFTEMGFTGKIPRTHDNMRTEFAWMVALNADHYNINSIPNQQFDLGIIIIPKKNPQFDVNKLKQYCNEIAVMQEGPNWYWQDYPLNQQIWYYNTILLIGLARWSGADLSLPATLGMVAIATGLEQLSWGGLDNLSVPLSVGMLWSQLVG